MCQWDPQTIHKTDPYLITFVTGFYGDMWGPPLTFTVKLLLKTTRIMPKKNFNFARIAKRNMNFWADQKNTKLSLTLELINNVFADLPI